MSDDVNQGEHTQPAGCVIHTSVCGDTAEEIELAALDDAREFFGPDRRLEVVADYQVTRCNPGTSHAGHGKKFAAGVRVRTVEAGS